MADDYLLARKAESKATITTDMAEGGAATTSASLGGAKTAAGVQTALTRGRYTNGLEGKQCYQCGEFGHLMLSCPRRPRPAQMGWSHTANGMRRELEAAERVGGGTASSVT